MRTYKNWAHKISSWEYVTSWRPVLPVFPAQRWIASALHPELLQGVSRSAATAARDLILAEVDASRHPWQVPIYGWQAQGQWGGQGGRLVFIIVGSVCVCVCLCVRSLDKRGKLTLRGRPSSRKQQEAGLSFRVYCAHLLLGRSTFYFEKPLLFMLWLFQRKLDIGCEQLFEIFSFSVCLREGEFFRKKEITQVNATLQILLYQYLKT